MSYIRDPMALLAYVSGDWYKLSALDGRNPPSHLLLSTDGKASSGLAIPVEGQPAFADSESDDGPKTLTINTGALPPVVIACLAETFLENAATTVK